MDRRLILAVAGAGKTTYLVNKMNLTERFLVITYTNNNLSNLRNRIIKKFGYWPSNIFLLSYFDFLYNICLLPFAKDELGLSGMCLDAPPEHTRNLPRNNRDFFLTKDGRIYSNRIAILCQKCLCKEIKERLEKYFDFFFFDEVQDLAGYDFDFVQSILPDNINILMVGDFFQHTYNTSRDGNKNGSLYDDISKYIKKWNNLLTIDTVTLSKSHRCPPIICDFVQQRLNIPIESHREITDVHFSYISTIEDAEIILSDKNIIKLFFQSSNKYNLYAMNWGESKGLDDFNDVCVILNKTTDEHYKKNELSSLNALTRNKLYVACTRAKRNLYFIPETLLENYKI